MSKTNKHTQIISKLNGHLKSIFTTYGYNDDDWTTYISEQLIDNQELISSSEKLYDLIKDDLEDIASADKDKHSICKLVFEFLKQNNLIKEEFLESESEEEEEKKNSEENEDMSKIKELDDDEDSYLEEGCCLMCERKMLLTKHHVIPKEVHEWYRKHHGMTKEQLHQGIMICRSCHSALHSFEDNKTLAEKYSTIEAILEHPKVQKWLPYIRKRKPRCKNDHRTLAPNGPRNLPPRYEDYDD
jgi:hypothetical protein